MFVKVFVAIGMIDWDEDEDHSFGVFDGMVGDVSFSGFKTFVGIVFETESGSVEGGGLFGVSDPEGDVV